MKLARNTLFAAVALAWITCAGFLAYWHLAVEPRLGEHHGSGVGFGWVAVHRVLPALAFLLTISTFLIQSFLAALARRRPRPDQVTHP